VPHGGLPSEPTSAGAHTPSALEPRDCKHTSQAPLQAAVQHTPSETKPLAHVVGSVDGCPFFSLHAPLESQVLVPVQVSESSAPATVAQTLALQSRHVPHWISN
jgi:hypothetical protein